MPTIPKFPFQIGGKGKSEGLIGKNILGNTMIAASNTLRKSLAKVATRRAPSSQKVNLVEYLSIKAKFELEIIYIMFCASQKTIVLFLSI